MAAFMLTGWPGNSNDLPQPALQVQFCQDRPHGIGDGRLERVTAALLQQTPQLKLQTDDDPCLHLKSSVRILARTARKDYLTDLAGYEFVTILNGEGYLLVERFRSSKPQNLKKLSDSLLARAPRSLVTEASTRYDVFVSSGDLILMISSATGYEENAKLMHKIRRIYSIE